MSIFCSRAKLLRMLNKFVVYTEDKHFKIEFSVTENTSVN